MKTTTKTLIITSVLAFFAACGDKEEATTPSPEVQDTTPAREDTIPAGWVDLGLPSGLLWAECNLGASAPEEYGDYYAWGETSPKSMYNWQTYRYCNGGENKMTKYCNLYFNGDNGFTDTLLTLLPEDDAATVVLGEGARIPTVNEWRELNNNAYREYATVNGVEGLRFSGNGNSIFLPNAGEQRYSEIYDTVSRGEYWSSSVFDGGPKYAWYFGINREMAPPNTNYAYRFSGMSIRAVRQK